MSRSTKKNPVFKGKDRTKFKYNKIIRRVQKQYVAAIAKNNDTIANSDDAEIILIPNRNTIVNRYDIYDYLSTMFASDYLSDEDLLYYRTQFKRK